MLSFKEALNLNNMVKFVIVIKLVMKYKIQSWVFGGKCLLRPEVESIFMPDAKQRALISTEDGNQH